MIKSCFSSIRTVFELRYLTDLHFHKMISKHKKKDVTEVVTPL